MPITGPIPLPGSGMDAFSGSMNNVMRNILARQQMAQGDVQQRRAIEQQQRALAQADSHFRQQQALRQQQEKRMAGMGDIQRQMAQLQMQKLEMETDPEKKAAYIKTLIDSAQNFGAPPSNMSSGGMHSAASSGGMPPTQQTDQGFMGRGMFPTQDMQSEQPQPMQPPTQQSGQYSPQQLEALRSQFLKMATGLDVNAETPARKIQKQIDLFREKEKIKAEGKKGSDATTSTLTANQKSLQAIDLTLPVIKSLIDSKDLPGIFSFDPSKRQAYESKTGGIIDTLIAAQDLPKIAESVSLVKQQLRRGTGETVESYKQRLRELYDHLLERKKSAARIVGTRKVTEAPDFSSMTDEQLHNIASGGG